MNKHAILFSVRPKFAERIFNGTKTVELRRVRPTVLSGELALVYVTSPTKELQGAFEVSGVLSEAPSTLWKKVSKGAGVTRKEFFAYFEGKKLAHAIMIRCAWKLSMPIQLSNLQRQKGGFRPPQSFHYIRRVTCPAFIAITNAANENSRLTTSKRLVA
jgi:predicted transcriptional regulator